MRIRGMKHIRLLDCSVYIELYKYKAFRAFAPLFYFNCEHVLFVYIVNKNFVDFQNFQKSNFDGGKFLKIWSFINLPWGHVMSHKKFGPDRFSRFDVYWIQTDKQTNRQTNKQTDKPNLYIDSSFISVL